MSRLRFLTLLSFFGAACAHGNAVDDSPSTESQVTATGAVSGKFKLYSEPSHQVDPACDMYTELDLAVDIGAASTAKLEDKFSGWCVGLVDHGPRSFTLTMDTGECRSRVYTGGSDEDTITITDYRGADCPGASPLVVRETADGHTTTMYFGGSLDASLADGGTADASTRDGAVSADGGSNSLPPPPPCTAAACFYGDTRITGLDGCEQTAAFCYSIEPNGCNKTTWCMRKKK
jgi:hypothetical protein